MSFSSRLRRTSLAVPATNERALAKARTLDADEVFVDLEDAVSADAKSEVREGAARALAGGDWRAQTLSLRINGVATTWWRDDLEVVVRGAAGRLDSVVLPKVESGGDVETVAGVLAELEAELGLKRPIALQAQIESPKGLIEVERIAGSSTRLETLVFGPGDYAASLGIGQRFIGEIASGYPGDQWHYARSRIAAAAHAFGLQPIDGPYAALADEEGLRESARRARMLGFQGKWVIHPDQIEIVNEVFSPTEEELAHAVRVLDALATADDGGQGVGVVGGAMVDEASRKLAEGIVRRAQAAGKDMA
jgi:citrate lyase subunit beta / citryl-CoA lyase